MLEMGASRALPGSGGAFFVGKGPDGHGETLGEPEEAATATTPACTCTASMVRRYLSKVSGPLMNEFDVHIETSLAPRLPSSRPGESSATVRARVVAARERQRARGSGQLNARLRGKKLRDACMLDESTQTILSAAVEQFSLSRSRLDSLLRTARSVADVDGRERVAPQDIEEAINYRPLASKLFA